MITETDVSAETRALAKRFYLAYTANSGNKNFQGNDCPAWEKLPDIIRSHWCAVAEEETHRVAHHLETHVAAAVQRVVTSDDQAIHAMRQMFAGQANGDLDVSVTVRSETRAKPVTP